MALQSQAATLWTNSLPKGHLHSRRTHRRSKHFTQHLTCRSMPQKVQAPSHTVAKSTYPSWLRKHPHLHMAAEMARHPATPGLLFTAAGVTGCLVASEAASKLVDRTSHRVEELGDGLNRQLHQASDSIAVQTKVSQAAFQEWKGLMSGILSEEANKIQAELDHASSVVTAWQQRSAGSSSQAEGPANRRQLNAHPLSMPQLELPKLESGWLVDAVQQRFPEIGASDAWPTSFSPAAGSDSMSGSDDEEARSPPSPSSLASHFVNHARQLAEQLGKPTGSATMDKEASQAAPTASTLATHFMNKAKQLTWLGFGVSNFSSASRLEREPDFIQDRKQELSSPRQLPPPSQTTALLPPADKPSRLSSSMTSTASPAAAKSTTATMEASSALLPAQNPAHSASSPAAAKAVPTQAIVKCKQSEAALVKLEEPVANSPVQSQGASSTAPDRGLPAKAQIFAASAPGQAKEPVSSTPIKTSPSTAAPFAPGQRGTDSPIQPASSSAAVTGACSSSAVKPAPAQVASFNSTAVRPPTALPAPTQGSSSALPASSSSSPAAASPSAAAAAPSPAVPSSSSVAPPVPSPAVPSSSSVASPAHSPAVRSSSSVPPLAPSPAVPSSSSAAAAAAPSSAASTSAPSEPSGPDPTPSDPSSVTSQAAPSSSTSSRAPILAPAIVEQPVPVAEQGVPEQTASTAQPSSTSHALMPEPLQPAEVSSHAAQHSQQQRGKSTSKPVRVVRPDPTPNWRTPRPLTPPPTPVQQGHPLSAPPAAAGQSQTVPGQCNAGETENAAPHSPAGSEDTAEMFDVLNSTVDSSSLRTQTARPQSINSGAESASNHEPASPSSSSISSDELGVTNPAVTKVTTSDRLPTTAAATAEEIDSSTAVIDSIPWGSSGIATAKGRSVPTQSGGGGGGGGGGATGGSTGGGGGDGGSDRPLDNNGGEDGDHVSTSPWWVKWLLVGSLVGAINLRDHIQRIPDIDEQPTEELPADETEADGIMTNIKAKEGDTAWSVAEEYGGSAAAWPEVVSSNPTADTAKPVAGTTLQIRVRL